MKSLKRHAIVRTFNSTKKEYFNAKLIFQSDAMGCQLRSAWIRVVFFLRNSRLTSRSIRSWWGTALGMKDARALLSNVMLSGAQRSRSISYLDSTNAGNNSAFASPLAFPFPALIFRRMSDGEFIRPFPALTPAQRYHLEVYGYVVIENAIEQDLTDRLLEAMLRLKRDLLSAPDPAKARVRNCRLSSYRPHYLHFAHILEADPAIFEYLTHPRLVGMAEELVGGSVRLEESEAVVNERDPELDLTAAPRYGFHTGTDPRRGHVRRKRPLPLHLCQNPDQPHGARADDGGTVGHRRQPQGQMRPRDHHRRGLRRPHANPPSGRARRINPALWRGPDPRHRPDPLRARARHRHRRLYPADVPKPGTAKSRAPNSSPKRPNPSSRSLPAATSGVGSNAVAASTRRSLRDPTRAPIPIVPRRRRRPASRQNGRWRRPVAARTVHWPTPAFPTATPTSDYPSKPSPKRAPPAPAPSSSASPIAAVPSPISGAIPSCRPLTSATISPAACTRALAPSPAWPTAPAQRALAS